MNNKNFLKQWDWKQKIGLFLIILAVISIIISLILFGTALFNDSNNSFLGNEFWSLKHYGIINLFNNWSQINNDAAVNSFINHPFYQIYIGIILLIIIFPVCSVIASFLLIRSWLISRI